MSFECLCEAGFKRRVCIRVRNWVKSMSGRLSRDPAVGIMGDFLLTHSNLVWLCLPGHVSAPRGSGPASTKAAWRLRSWGSQMELAEAEQETGSSFFLVLSPDSNVRISLLRELVYIRNLL